MQVDKELEQLEQEINPILGDDPQVALSYLFGKVVEEMKATPDVCPCGACSVYITRPTCRVHMILTCTCTCTYHALTVYVPTVCMFVHPSLSFVELAISHPCVCEETSRLL